MILYIILSAITTFADYIYTNSLDLAPREISLLGYIYVGVPFDSSYWVPNGVTTTSAQHIWVRDIYYTPCTGRGVKMAVREIDPEGDDNLHTGDLCHSEEYIDVQCDPESKWHGSLTVPHTTTGSSVAVYLVNCSSDQPVTYLPRGGDVSVKGDWGFLDKADTPLLFVTEMGCVCSMLLLCGFCILCRKRSKRISTPHVAVLCLLVLSLLVSLIDHHYWCEHNDSLSAGISLKLLRDCIAALYRCSVIGVLCLLSLGFGLVSAENPLKNRFVLIGLVSYFGALVLKDLVESFFGQQIDLISAVLQVPQIFFALVGGWVSYKFLLQILESLGNDDRCLYLVYRQQKLLNFFGCGMVAAEGMWRVWYSSMGLPYRLPYRWIAIDGFFILVNVIFLSCTILVWRPQDIEKVSKLGGFIGTLFERRASNVEAIASHVGNTEVDMLVELIDEDQENDILLEIKQIESAEVH